MSTISIALFGHNGKIGRRVLRNLAALNHVNLKVFHRASSDITGIPPHVDKVQVDRSDEEATSRGLTGTDVVISTIREDGIDGEMVIARAAKNAGVKRYIPSFYTSDEVKDGRRAELYNAVGGKHITDKSLLKYEIEKLGVPTTFVYIGLVADYALTFGFVLPSILRNTGTMTETMLSIQYPISSFQYIAQEITEIASSSTYPKVGQSEIATLIEFAPTGQDLISALETVNGTPPKIDFISQQDLADRASGKSTNPMPWYALSALLTEEWSTGNVLKHGENDVKVSGTTRSLLDFVKELKDNPLAPPGRG